MCFAAIVRDKVVALPYALARLFTSDRSNRFPQTQAYQIVAKVSPRCEPTVDFRHSLL